MKEYRMCTRCIMDTSDPDISFDENGICNHCREYDKKVEKYGYRGDDTRLSKVVDAIKRDGKGKEYDCVLGISGGVDSAYMAYVASQLGLRILAIHVDAGWNSDIAVSNIRKLCEKLDIDLHTIVVDWPTMKELQRAYMFSGLANLDVPQDHAFMAGVYKYASKYKIKYMLNGSNLATEGILPKAWGYSALDYRCIKSVYKKCGRNKISLKKYPKFSLLSYIIFHKKIIRVNLLNYVPYSKKMAMDILQKEFGWEYYGGKHYESRFTKFFQAYYLPKKFNYDKKRAHLSSLIVGGEMTREEALKEIEDHSEYTEEQQLEDRDYILKKLDISKEEWDQIMKMKNRTEDDYATNKNLIKLGVKVKQAIYYGMKKGGK